MPALSEVPRAAMTANRGRRDLTAAAIGANAVGAAVEQPLNGGGLLQDLVSQAHAREPAADRAAGADEGDHEPRQGHLTEPARIPRTNARWSTRNTSSGTIIVRNAPAVSRCQAPP